jgi:hypothetical protein
MRNVATASGARISPETGGCVTLGQPRVRRRGLGERVRRGFAEAMTG